MSNHVNTLSYVQEFISAHTGLSVSDKDLMPTVSSRMKDLGFVHVDGYCRFLESDTPESKNEWKRLCQIITTGESFFFRDKGQFQLLRDTIVRNIIDANKDSRTIRIWSAGCSTGEEPYSLAIIVLELLPVIERWNVSITGSDINEDAIEKARKGIYSDWSFRMVDPAVVSRYFHRRWGMFELDERVRRMVSFRQGNLIMDSYPDAAVGICDIDLIICRNVFIYFQPDKISLVLGKLSRTLNKGGYLITGHAELQAVQLHGLAAVTYPQSILYRRLVDQDAHETAISRQAKQLSITNVQKNVKITTPKSAPHTTAAKELADGAKVKERVKSPNGEDLFAEAQSMYKEGKYHLAIEKTTMVIKETPRHFGAHVLMARSCANTGDLKRAANACNKAIEIDSLKIEPYYMLAQIAEEQGRRDEARELFKRVIYLDATCIAAYVELSEIYNFEGDIKRAVKLRESAVNMLKGLSADTVVEFYHDTAAGELLAHLNQSFKRRAGDWQVD